MPGIQFKIGTFNIQNTVDDYSERKESLKNVVKEMDCDIISLQEVNYLEQNQIKDLEIEDHITFYAKPQHNFKNLYEIDDEEFNIDGNVISFKKEFYDKHVKEVEEEILYLSPVRIAHLLIVKLKESDDVLIIVNNHLHHCNIELQEDLIRLHQIFFIEKLIAQKSFGKKGHVFWMGDFNAFPHEKTYNQIISNGFKSSFKEFAGEEPAITWPADKDLITEHPKGCMDYIFIKPFNSPATSLSILATNLFGDKPVNLSKGLYPSDHLAIRVEYMLC